MGDIAFHHDARDVHPPFETRGVIHTRLNPAHLPIVFSIELAPSVFPCHSHIFTNYSKAEWESFRRETEQGFGATSFLPSCSDSKQTLRQITANVTTFLQLLPEPHLITLW